ncbi:MAG: hypothetical protein ACTSPB_01140 [Candidatus Thorarchaeota archaeon]
MQSLIRCPSCGSEVDETFECWECGTEICEHCMYQSIAVAGDYCEGCGEIEEAKQDIEGAREVLENHGVTYETT